jgi:hypothetical protein
MNETTPKSVLTSETQLIEGSPIVNESIVEDSPIINELIAEGSPIINESIAEGSPIAKGTEPIAGEILPVATEVVKDSVENSKEEIMMSTNKSTLGMLSQNLNANLLVTAAAYKALLSKLKDNVTNVEKQQGLEENIKEVENLEKILSDLLVKVQSNLDIESDKLIDPTNVIEEAKGSGNFMQTLLNTEAIAILAAMMAPIGLGGGSKRKKMTKRRKNKGKKLTKRSSKI